MTTDNLRTTIQARIATERRRDLTATPAARAVITGKLTAYRDVLALLDQEDQA